VTTICPTILAEEMHGYDVQLRRVLLFARRLHIDLMDGIFASPCSVSLNQVHWPANVTADLHIMYKNPLTYLEQLVTLHPQMVIVHAEAAGDFMTLADTLHQHGIEVGVALLPQTAVSEIAPALGVIDHVLIFSGKLGHFGGEVDLHLLAKARELRSLKPTLEIAWDGGVNPTNAAQLAAAGIDVLNVGGFIQHAANSTTAYMQLVQAAQ
jgi:ribulose-phosphate 3-epimerase